jgi:hypothetical protein
MREGYPFTGKTTRDSRQEWRKFKRGLRFVPGSEWSDRAGEVESELVYRTGDGELVLFFQIGPPDPIAWPYNGVVRLFKGSTLLPMVSPLCLPNLATCLIDRSSSTVRTNPCRESGRTPLKMTRTT